MSAFAGSRGGDRRTLVKRVDLVRSLDAMPDSSKERHIFLRADRAVPYGELMDVLEICAPAAIRRSSWSRSKVLQIRRRSGVASKAMTGLDEQCHRGGSGFLPR